MATQLTDLEQGMLKKLAKEQGRMNLLERTMTGMPHCQRALRGSHGLTVDFRKRPA